MAVKLVLAPHASKLARVAGALWLAVIAATLAVGAFASPSLGSRLVVGGPACPWKLLVGFPCPFCGMTHATVALGAGDLHGALAAHPLAPLVLLVMIAVGVLAVSGASWAWQGKRPRIWLGIIAVIWILRFTAF